MSDAVVITGMGAVLAGGAGRDALRRALAEPAKPVATEPGKGYHRPGDPRRFLSAGEVDLTPWLSPRAARRMSVPSRFATAAAKMAVEDAGLDPARLGEETTAVALATAFGTARFAEHLIQAILEQGPEAASPFHFSESVANAPAAQVSIALGATGAQVAVTQREAGPLLAVVLGARELRRHRARYALVGATDEVSPLVHAILARFRALAGRHGRPEIARPFDRHRDGLLAAEGSTVLLLERAEDAAERGATVLARVEAWERGFDPTAPSWGFGAGAKGLADRLRSGLARQEIDPGSIDAVVASAAGTRGGDALEAAVLHQLFGADPPPVLAPKGAVGEYGGGQLAAAVLAAAGQTFPTAGFETADPALGLTPHDGSPLPAAKRLLVSALATGGSAAWVVLGAP